MSSKVLLSRRKAALFLQERFPQVKYFAWYNRLMHDPGSTYKYGFTVSKFNGCANDHYDPDDLIAKVIKAHQNIPLSQSSQMCLDPEGKLQFLNITKETLQ